MKLLPVLVLTALPFYCYAGVHASGTEQLLHAFIPSSGCTLVTQVINQAIDPQVSEKQYIEYIREFIPDAETEESVKQAKQCFLQQSEETLTNAQVMVETIYNSVWCKPY
ncbi:mammaglobin-A-like [Saccopteryx leptura]|uniref:mammaglobin-A-like n=1 Tax=Saccopteryx leptura TaxID=249018 RepID=UPI00339C2C0C